MHLLLVGMDHHTAPRPNARRSRSAKSRRARCSSARRRVPRFGESVVLSTCNRTEFYVATDDVAAARRALRGVVEATRGLDLLAPDTLPLRTHGCVGGDASVPRRLGDRVDDRR